MVMVIAAIVLAVMAAMIYMMTTSTQVSGLSKRYSTAREASQGGQSVMEQLIRARGVLDPKFINSIGLYIPSDDCVKDKMIKDTKDWAPICNTSTVIDTSDEDTYDMRFVLGDYLVYAKIAYTVEGNSGQSDTDLKKTGVVVSNAAEVSVEGVPYYYAVEVDARHQKIAGERARLSLLLQY